MHEMTPFGLDLCHGGSRQTLFPLSRLRFPNKVDILATLFSRAPLIALFLLKSSHLIRRAQLNGSGNSFRRCIYTHKFCDLSQLLFGVFDQVFVPQQ